jgi:tripartite-type tricarboxylate transporter receptor subunit TctC
MTIIPSTHAKLRIDPVRDFAAIGQVVELPQILVGQPSFPARNVKELTAIARQKPGQVDYAAGSYGGSGHMAMELFLHMASIRLSYVPYKSGTAALTDLVGGHVQIMFSNPVAAASHLTNGRLRALGITSATRFSLFPNVPTIAEAGVPGYESNTWYGVLLPAATPVAIVNTLNREIQKILDQPDIKKRIQNDGGNVVGGTPQEFSRYMQEDILRWKKLVEVNPKLRIDE